MNTGEVLQVEIALQSLADDCRILIAQGADHPDPLRARGYLGGFKTGLDHLAGTLDALRQDIKKLRMASRPFDEEAALDILRRCTDRIAQELEHYMKQPDQWSAGQSSAYRWCLPTLRDIFRAARARKLKPAQGQTLRQRLP